MASVGAEWLEKDYAGRQDDLIRSFIAGEHDFQKRFVREVLGEGLYLECCKRRVDKALSECKPVSDLLNPGELECTKS